MGRPRRAARSSRPAHPPLVAARQLPGLAVRRAAMVNCYRDTAGMRPATSRAKTRPAAVRARPPGRAKWLRSEHMFGMNRTSHFHRTCVLIVGMAQVTHTAGAQSAGPPAGATAARGTLGSRLAGVTGCRMASPGLPRGQSVPVAGRPQPLRRARATSSAHDQERPRNRIIGRPRSLPSRAAAPILAGPLTPGRRAGHHRQLPARPAKASI